MAIWCLPKKGCPRWKVAVFTGLECQETVMRVLEVRMVLMECTNCILHEFPTGCQKC
jgi:hypothetical protein